jgi:hypothetical protein
MHWQHFIDYYAKKNDLEVIEYLLTDITPKLAAQYDKPYVPHRGVRDGFKNCMFYMQTVFPHIFSVNSLGWGADCSFLPVGTGPCDDVFDKFKERIGRNESFFWQPPVQEREPFDIFFACQLPHDMNVVQQSDTGVLFALEQTLEFASENNLKVVAKGEAVLHEKPCFAFGRANYSEVAAPSLSEAFDWKPDYRGFFNNWYAACEDYTRGDN